jgi:hypothetical protein
MTIRLLALAPSLALLIACGGSQTPIGTLDTRQPAMQRSTTSGGPLLYVVMGGSHTHMLTYPGFKQVTRIPVWGLSTSNPNNGDVLIGGLAGPVNLYAHGGTKILHRFGYSSQELIFYDSAFDPTNNAIAITGNMEFGGAYVYVYQTPTSTPIKYTVPNIRYIEFIGYDGQGNLFVDGQGSTISSVLAELPKGGNAFMDLTVAGTINNPGSIQWDGSYITVVSGASIYRLQISGSTASIAGQTTLTLAWGRSGDFWIQGNTVIAPHISDRPHNGRWVGFWHYPAGGRAYKVIKNLSKDQQDRMISATVSIAPPR